MDDDSFEPCEVCGGAVSVPPLCDNAKCDVSWHSFWEANRKVELDAEERSALLYMAREGVKLCDMGVGWYSELWGPAKGVKTVQRLGYVRRQVGLSLAEGGFVDEMHPTPLAYGPRWVINDKGRKAVENLD